jgi:enamine deaminase RidA (YjgF/YER057c/UK114 family)
MIDARAIGCLHEKVRIIGALRFLQTFNLEMLMAITRLNPTPRWSDAVIYRGVAHFVEVPADTSVDMKGQIDQLLGQAEVTLVKLGSDKSRLLSVTIYLTRLEDVALLNSAWEAWLPAQSAPARACVKVELLDPSMRVEIAFIAATD